MTISMIRLSQCTLLTNRELMEYLRMSTRERLVENHTLILRPSTNYCLSTHCPAQEINGLANVWYRKFFPKISASRQREGIKKLGVFKKWFEDSVVAIDEDGCTESLLLLPWTFGKPDYRDLYRGEVESIPLGEWS